MRTIHFSEGFTMLFKKSDPVARINTTSDGLALRGYDPVAYFTEGKAVRGRQEFEYEWGGARHQFSSAENRDRFVSNPERYAAQYGGYCAWGISQAKFFDGDPEVWKIVNGKLYVNYNQDIEQTWQQDVPGFIAKADQHWPELTGGSR
jgi:YHS domain-containing protein